VQKSHVHVITFGSFLDIRENSEWFRLIWSTLYVIADFQNCIDKNVAHLLRR